MNRMSGFGALLPLLVIAGCASSSLPSVTEPEFHGTTFGKIVVLADIEDVVWKKRIESQIVEAFTDEGIESVESISLAGGILSPSDTNISSMLKKNNVDAYLIVTTGDEGTTEIVSRPAGMENPLPAQPDGRAFITPQPARSPVTQRDDNSFYPRGELKSGLFEAASRRLAWSVASHNEMNVYSSLSLVIKSYSRKVVAQLIHDGLVKPVPKTGKPDTR